MTAPTVVCDLEFSGTLIEKAVMRHVVLDKEGHTVPALCFVVELDAAGHQHCKVEQFFPIGQEKQCEAAARRLPAGTRIAFQVPSVGVRLVASNVSHVHVLHEQEQGAHA